MKHFIGPDNPMRAQFSAQADRPGQHFAWTCSDAGVATLTLNRPERKNPLTFDSYAELRDRFWSLQARDRREGPSSSPARGATSARAATCTRSSARSPG